MRKVKKVAKMGKRILSAVVVMTLMAGMPQITCSASAVSMLAEDLEENSEVEVLEAILIEDEDLPCKFVPYTMLASCIITASGASDGMHIDISTGAVGTASVLGVKDIKVYKKTWYGGWNLVATSEGKEVKNRSMMGINLLYSNAVKGATYKITCIHYGNVDGYIEGSNDSGEILFTY